MAAKMEERKAVPPYLSYKTFMNFINGLAETTIPMRIDRDLLRNLSGAAQGHLLATLKYLELIDQKGKPDDRLGALARSQGDARKRLLLEVLKKSYPFLFSNDFDIQRATSRLMHEKFTDAGASGDTVRKAVAFFLTAAEAAGVPISPHIKRGKGPAPGNNTRRRRPAPNTQAQSSNGARIETPPPAPPGNPNNSGGINPNYGHVSKIALSDNREAIFSIPDRLSLRDAQRIKGALQGLAAIIDSMVDDQNEIHGGAA
ncbi:MAG: DUF5343 domain-containing protein [Acidobacteria bacterium]|nr:DUF5343 domain-containing protein [Acidobacteriota bacterium]